MTDIDAPTRVAVGEVLALYCHAIDRRAWDLAAGCFHEDASYSFGPIDGDWRTFVEMAKAMIDPLPMTHHQLGQISIAADGDADGDGERGALAVETYFTATHLVPADAAADAAAFAGRGHDYHAIIAGRYNDRFTARGGEWRIERRVGTIDWRHDIALLPVAATA